MVKPMKKLEKKQRAPEKDIKQDTTLLTTSSPQEMVQKMKRVVMVIAVIFAVMYAYFWYQGGVSEKAENQFGIAMVDIRMNNTDKAEAKLNEIITNFSGSSAADKATYFLAELYLTKGVYASARESFSNYSGSDDLLKSASKAGIALCYEKENNYAEAASNYLQAVSISGEHGSNNASYLFAAGVNFELAKNVSDAKDAFKRIQDDYKSFSKMNIVDMKLSSM